MSLNLEVVGQGHKAGGLVALINCWVKGFNFSGSTAKQKEGSNDMALCQRKVVLVGEIFR